MSPQLIALIIGLIEELITQEPQIAAELQALFAKQHPTPADWSALRARILSKTYRDYVPASALPDASVLAKIPPVATAAPQTNAPINVSGALPQPSEAQKAPQTPYLPDGSRNPGYNHLVPPKPAPSTN